MRHYQSDFIAYFCSTEKIAVMDNFCYSFISNERQRGSQLRPQMRREWSLSQYSTQLTRSEAIRGS